MCTGGTSLIEYEYLREGQVTSVNLVLTGSFEGLLIPIDLMEISQGQDITEEVGLKHITTAPCLALRFVSTLQDRQHEAEIRQAETISSRAW
jgi:hypothetical protein